MPRAYIFTHTCEKALAHRFDDAEEARRFTQYARGRVQDVSTDSRQAFVVELRPWVWAVHVEICS